MSAPAKNPAARDTNQAETFQRERLRLASLGFGGRYVFAPVLRNDPARALLGYVFAPVLPNDPLLARFLGTS